MRRFEKRAYNSFRMRSSKNTRPKVALLTSLTQRPIFYEDEETVMVFSNGAGGAMPEIGLLPFARVARDVATAILPAYRSRFSNTNSPAAAAGHTPPDALRRLDFPRSRGATARACGVARRVATVEGARLHPRVSLLAAAARRYHGERVGRIGTPAAPQFAPRPTTSGGGGGRHRTLAPWRQHLLPPPHRAARPETLSALSEVAVGRRRGPANHPGAAGAPRAAV
jgi:hypothetical protein